MTCFHQALWRSALAELFGTAIFVFFGTGAVVAILNSNRANGVAFDAGSLVLISMAFGFGLTVVIYSVGEISGGHINPAVTFATLMTGRLSVVRAAIYWVFNICDLFHLLFLKNLYEQFSHAMAFVISGFAVDWRHRWLGCS